MPLSCSKSFLMPDVLCRIAILSQPDRICSSRGRARPRAPSPSGTSHYEQLLVQGKTWTGFANSEEQYADEFVGQRIQPFRIEDEAKKIPNTNFIVIGCFKSHAVRDGNLITGQQQYSATAAARLMIEALGV